ncbi:hypothetical protein [Altericista sp. CCNU0014]|uniref:hypothetical protein n=1 Tax=Altericista sp. CCNU0014 TaxID=3082949 RepID=UPI0038506EC2
MAYYPNPNHASSHKPIGAYLVEAGLLSDAQVGVALADQSVTSMPFGEILVTRGWIKAQTIEYLMQKIIIPERVAEKSSFSDLENSLVRQHPKSTYPGAMHHSAQSGGYRPALREAASKPQEEGVNWIG